MRFIFLELPALIVTILFRGYVITLTAMALLCWLTVLYSAAALALEWPRIW